MFSEYSHEGTFGATETELVEAPTRLDGKKTVLTLTVFNPNVGAVIFEVKKKKGASLYVIERQSLAANTAWALPATARQVLKATDESLVIQATAAPTTPLDFTVTWADILR